MGQRGPISSRHASESHGRDATERLFRQFLPALRCIGARGRAGAYAAPALCCRLMLIGLWTTAAADATVAATAAS